MMTIKKIISKYTAPEPMPSYDFLALDHHYATVQQLPLHDYYCADPEAPPASKPPTVHDFANIIQKKKPNAWKQKQLLKFNSFLRSMAMDTFFGKQATDIRQALIALFPELSLAHYNKNNNKTPAQLKVRLAYFNTLSQKLRAIFNWDLYCKSIDYLKKEDQAFYTPTSGTPQIFAGDSIRLIASLLKDIGVKPKHDSDISVIETSDIMDVKLAVVTAFPFLSFVDFLRLEDMISKRIFEGQRQLFIARCLTISSVKNADHYRQKQTKRTPQKKTTQRHYGPHNRSNDRHPATPDYANGCPV